ncbi:hypothetical protein DFH06DRAFT_773975 [Mycena polygramma]|nr:hypothetical protein DFH06DRAFT_773975 [Mycena polygramma]
MTHCGLSPQNFLLLIENSSAVAAFWPELRDCYLPTLVEQLSGSHPTHLRNIFISESRPALHNFQSPVHKQCSNVEDGLNELQFNYEQDNRLSVAQIQGSIKFLSSTPTTDVRHLIVVAATTPVEFGFGHPSFDPWNELAKLLAKEEVYFHLALTSSLRSGPLPKLFEQTLKRQQHTEEPLWLPKYSTAFIFRVAAPETYPDGAQPNSETKGEESICAARAQRDTIPSDIYTTKAIDEISSESPSLVSQLQQHHGLTKKKVYGTKPPRVPFIMDEPARDRYRKPSSKPSPTSVRVASETGAPPLLTRSARSRSNLRGDRAFSARPQRTADPYAVRAPPQWASQRPEDDSPGHSSYSPSSSPSSPVAQMPVTESYPGRSYPVESSGAGHSPMVSPEEFDLPWAQKGNACSAFYPTFSCRAGYIPGCGDAGVQDASLLPNFQSIPTPCEIMATGASMTRPFSEFPSELDFHAGLDLYQQHRDDHGGLSFPPVSPPAQRHIHAPTPSMLIPAGDLLAAPTLRRALPPPMPSVSGPTPDRARASVTAASQSMQPRNANPHAVYASTPARSGRSRDGFASSSSLTGWAG